MATYNMPFHVSEFDIRRQGSWLLWLGIGMIILGLVALGASLAATYFSVMAIGVIMIVAGIVECVRATAVYKWSGFFVSLLVGLLYLFIGLLIISSPALTAVALTLVMAVLFVVSGVFRMITALVHRFENWEWLMISGVVSFVLGLLIWTGWPLNALWIIGLFVAIDLIVYGWWSLYLGSIARHISPKQTDVV